MYWNVKSKTFLLIFLLPLFIYAQTGSFKSHIHLDQNKSEGLSWVQITDEKGSYSFEWEYLEPLAEDYLTEETTQELRKHVRRGWINFSGIKKSGLSVVLNEETLNIYIKSNKQTAKTYNLSLTHSEQEKQGEALSSSFFSSYLNLRFNKAFNLSENTQNLNLNTIDSDDFQGSVEHVLNLGGLVFENEFKYERALEETDSSPWSRSYSRVVYDDIDSMVRYSAGDIIHPIGYYQNYFQTAGFSISRAFDINPLFLRSNFRRSEIYLQKSSTVEVYVNGRLQERRRYQKGTLNIEDFPFYNGENQVRIKVIDDFGRIEETSFSALNDIQLLGPGISDFSFNLGALRDLNSETINTIDRDTYNTDQWITTNFYRQGITHNFVLGAHAQGTYEDNWVGGFDSVLGTTWGISTFDVSYSYRDEMNSGYAYRINHQSNVLSDGEMSDVRYNFVLEYNSENFRRINTDRLKNVFNLRKWNVSGNLGQNFLRRLRGSFGFNYISFHDKPAKNYITTNFGWSPIRNWNFNVNSKVNVENTQDTTVFVSFNWFAPVNRQQYVATYRPVEKTFSADYSIDPVNTDQTLRTRAGVDISDDSNIFRANASYQNQRFELQVDHATTQRQELNEATHATQVRGGVGIAMASDIVSISRPINNSFALVSVKNKPNSKPIALNRFRNYQRGEVNIFGPASVADLTPYFRDYLKLDSNRLPPGYSLDKTSFAFLPRYKSGVAIKTSVSGTGSIQGTLKSYQGQPIELASGVITTVTYPKERRVFFTNRDGHFFIEDVKEGEYELRLKDYSDRKIRFTVERTEAGIVNIGEILYPVYEDNN